MAADRITLVYSIKDSKNQVTNKTFELVTTDETQAAIDAAAHLALYQPVCAGAIVSYSVNAENAVVDTPDAGSLKTDVMSITMQLDGRPEKANMRLPCFPDALSDANGVLLLADAAVIAFQNSFVLATPAICKVSDGEYITSFVRGKLKK